MAVGVTETQILERDCPRPAESFSITTLSIAAKQLHGCLGVIWG